MSEHDFKLNVDSLIDRLLEGMCKYENSKFTIEFVLLILKPIYFFKKKKKKKNKAKTLKCCWLEKINTTAYTTSDRLNESSLQIIKSKRNIFYTYISSNNRFTTAQARTKWKWPIIETNDMNKWENYNSDVNYAPFRGEKQKFFFFQRSKEIITKANIKSNNNNNIGYRSTSILFTNINCNNFI